MTPEKDNNGPNEVEILDLDYRLPPSGRPLGPPAPSERVEDGFPQAQNVQPRSPAEYEPRVAGTNNPKTGDSRITLGADGPDANGEVTLGNSRQGQTLGVQAVLLGEQSKTSARLSIGPNDTDSFSLATKHKNDEAEITVGTRNNESYGSLNVHATIDSHRIGAKATVGNGRSEALSFTEVIDKDSELGLTVEESNNKLSAGIHGKATIEDTKVAVDTKIANDASTTLNITQPVGGGSLNIIGTAGSPSTLEASYRIHGASGTVKAGTDGEVRASITYSTALPIGVESHQDGQGPAGISYKVAAANAGERADVLSGDRDERARRETGEKPPPWNAAEPNPRLVSQATGLLDSVNNHLPPGMSALPVRETAASLAVLAEQRGLSGIGFVQIGDPTSHGRNLFIGQESSIQEQVAAFGQHVGINAQEAGRGPTPAMLTDLEQIRMAGPAPEPTLEQQRTQGARSM